MTDGAFLRIAGALGVLSAVTTVLLWLLPRLYQQPESFDDVVALSGNGLYIGRLWVNLVHVAIALVAYTAAAGLATRRAPILAKAGLLWMTIWAAVELAGVSILIFAVNRTWRAGYPGADEAGRVAIRHALDAFAAAWDALFFVILVAFLLGTTLLGLALLHGRGLRRVVGLLHLLAAPLTVFIMLGEYWEAAWALAIADWVYPALQPASRALLGIWIWREAACDAGQGRPPRAYRVKRTDRVANALGDTTDRRPTATEFAVAGTLRRAIRRSSASASRSSCIGAN
jgi:hypothetical protein